MKPERIFSLIAGAVLLVTGATLLAGNLFLATKAWRLWPIIVLLAGLGLTAAGLLGISRRGFGAFFIPGLPVLAAGGILMFASLTNRWDIWAVAWPVEVLALALGFVLAAFFMRVPALAIPASILAFNGLLFLFCAVTGLWQAWALLWPLEFLSVGVGLLILGIAIGSSGVRLAANILFSVAGGGFFIMAFISVFNNNLLMKFAVPVMLLITGALLTGSVFFGRSTKKQSSSEPPIQEA